MNDEEKKFENELKKLKLIAEHGINERDLTQVNLPTDIESQWLDYITAFEKAAQKKEVKPVREVIGNPPVFAIEELNPELITYAIESYLALLQSKQIDLTILYPEDVSDEELYKFISEEFMDYEMNVVGIPGAVTQFTYEEFHPNHKRDLIQYTEEFLEAINTDKMRILDYHLADLVTLNDQQLNKENCISTLSKLVKTKSYKEHQHSDLSTQINLEEGYATVSGILNFELRRDHKTLVFSKSITLTFCLDFGFWSIQSIDIPDFH